MDKNTLKLNLSTNNIADENYKKLIDLFPNIVTETVKDGKTIRSIDIEKLTQEINVDIVDENNKQRYEFTWPDKRKSVVLANKPTRKTLRPCRQESVNFDETENLYIEGDNLEVLKLIRLSYMGKIKMIYIDPPYNTGNDFLYKDNFKMDRVEYKENSGQYDEDGNLLFSNTESNGRYHTDWLNMMYPRLRMARDLLTDDGAIFISIDDNEVSNLKKICDEIFGERNFIASIIWERAYAPVNLKKHFSTSHDYILCYSKNIEITICNGLSRTEKSNNIYSNPDNDSRGVWTSDNMSVGPAVESNIYPITVPSGRIVYPPSGRSWRVSESKFKENVKDNRVWFGADGNGVPRVKRFLNELQKTGITPMSIWKYKDVGHSQDATKLLKELFDNKAYFDYPKPIQLIKQMLTLYTDKDSIILDFFSGSATTAHAVMQLNAEDGGNRKFIMVQLPEETDKKSEAHKAGYKNICEIGKERIRRAGAKIKKENPESSIDTGFKVFKLDSSNMEDVYYKAEDLHKEDIMDYVNHIKEGRTEEDLLYQIILEYGLSLTAPIEQETYENCNIYKIDKIDDKKSFTLTVCFNENISEKVVEHILEEKPLYMVLSQHIDDKIFCNIEQIIKEKSEKTQYRVV